MSVAGTGGQGVLSAARLLGEAGFRRGLAVAVSQLHGMSQRGGSVESSVCFNGDGILPSSSSVDVLIGLELFEALRASSRLGKGSIALINPWLAVPPGTRLSLAVVPSAEEVMSTLRERAEVHVVEANAIATELGSRAAANLAMLGAFCAASGVIDPKDVLEAIERVGTLRMRSIAQLALALGYEAFARARASA